MLFSKFQALDGSIFKLQKKWHHNSFWEDQQINLDFDCSKYIKHFVYY